MNYYGFYFKEDRGFYKGKQFLNISYGPEYQKADEVWMAHGNSKEELFEEIVKKSGWPITKKDIVWVNDDFTN